MFELSADAPRFSPIVVILASDLLSGEVVAMIAVRGLTGQ